MQIYLARNNVQAGPYTLEQLNTMLASGEVSLDDLMWHEGMSKWQRLGDMTQGNWYYQPNNHTHLNNNTNTTEPQTSSTANQQNNSTSTSQKNEGRLTVEQLYGKAPATDTTPDKHKTSTTNSSPTNKNTSANKKSISDTEKTLTNAQGQTVILAPLMSRVLALVINSVLYLLSILPIGLALAKMDIDLDKFQNFTDFDAAYQYSISLVENIPSSTLMISQLMMFGLFAIQLLLIIRRGQSLGKLMTGIRVVDQKTYQLPSLGHVLGIRTFLLLLIYNILFSVADFFGLTAIIINYFMASKSPENIGWHDKIAKTLIVKAEDNQLKKEDT